MTRADVKIMGYLICQGLRRYHSGFVLDITVSFLLSHTACLVALHTLAYYAALS